MMGGEKHVEVIHPIHLPLFEEEQLNQFKTKKGNQEVK